MTPISILIVDDERAFSTACCMVLKDKGYTVHACLSGQAGINAVLHGSYDIVLLDLKLPDIYGIEVLRTVRRERPDLHVIVITAYSSVQNAVEALKLQASDYLMKPFSDDELLVAVQKTVEKKRLREENLLLRKEPSDRFAFHNIVGESPEMLVIYDMIEKVAPTDSTVILYGESGTGKELFARAIHRESPRADQAFVAVDCSTFSPHLLESELFGHVKGAFTDAIQDKQGIFEVADGGTLFLDEVANLSVDIQGKLLRVLETQEYKPVGASHARKTDVRIIAATNRNLKAMVDEASFRQDLFYRLNVFVMFLPPLRERRDDIPKLAYHFLRLDCCQAGKKIEGFSDDALDVLMNYHWPGNVRELKNVIERLVVMADRGVLDYIHLFDHLRLKGNLRKDSVPETLEELKAIKKRLIEEVYDQIEKAFLVKALKECSGNLTRAAQKVGIQRPNFHALMKKHHLPPKPKRGEP